MTFPWFKRTGLFFRPVTFFGWLILMTGIVCAVYTFIEIDSRSHSVSDTLINFLFNFLMIGGVYSIIAFLTSKVRN
jgi:hypothetical protein